MGAPRLTAEAALGKLNVHHPAHLRALFQCLYQAILANYHSLLISGKYISPVTFACIRLLLNITIATVAVST